MDPTTMMMLSQSAGQVAQAARAPDQSPFGSARSSGTLDGSNWTVNYGTYTQPESTTRALIIGAVVLAAVLIWKKGR